MTAKMVRTDLLACLKDGTAPCDLAGLSQRSPFQLDWVDFPSAFIFREEGSIKWRWQNLINNFHPLFKKWKTVHLFKISHVSSVGLTCGFVQLKSKVVI